MPELVLYGIRELVEQFLGPLLDIEVENSGPRELEELRREVRNCRENHQSHSVKREPEETNRPSTSRVKREPGVKAEYFEHGDEDIDIDLT